MAGTPARQYGAPQDPRRQYQSGGGGSGATPYGAFGRDTNQPQPKQEDPSPSATVVAQFHKNSDTDTRMEALHHTLGSSPTQASPGDHTHDGGSSPQILSGYNLTGSKSSPSTVLPSIIACLTRLGATDNTTA